MVDFERLRSAKHVCLSISSFSWLAAWLSSLAKTIHMPVAGIFDPRRGVQSLIPGDDARYRFWEVDIPKMKDRVSTDPYEWVASYTGSRELDRQRLRKIISAGATRRVNANQLHLLINSRKI